MKQTRFTRRQFLKAGAAGGLAAGFAGLLGPAPTYARKANDLAPEPPPALIPDRVHQTLTEPPATSLPSALLLGAPLADVSKGWDGTLWGIDTNGVPYHFDAIAQKWNVFGGGFDVITPYLNGAFYLIRGAQVVFNGRDPQPISSIWSGLPATFTQGLDGAAMAGGVLHLFRNGRYVTIDTATHAASAPVALNTFAGWPTTDHWQQGSVDVVGAHEKDVQQPKVLLWSKGEYVVADMVQKKVVEGPHSLDYYVGGQMLAYMQQGFTTMLWNETDYRVRAFNGPLMHSTFDRNGTAYVEYPSGYYPNWLPLLSHAPSGQAGMLWAAGRPNYGPNFDIFYHDGTNWQHAPYELGGTASVSVGADGSVFALSGSTQPDVHQFNFTTNNWSHVAAAPANAVQLAVADATHIWVRTSQNQVYRYNGNGGFAGVNLGHPALDIAAGTDGTLWHAAGDDHIYRYLPEGTEPSSAIPPGVPAGTIIDQIAGTGFGSAYVLSNTTAQLSNTIAQLYLYDTPYVFKTSAAYFPGNDPTRLRQTLSHAGHTLFASSLPPNESSKAYLVALDAQTGAERWRMAFSRSGEIDLLSVYDDSRQLVYVLNELDVYGLNTDTGAPVWHLDVAATLPGDALMSVALINNNLCLTTLGGKLVLIDVDDAQARAQQSQPPQAPQSITIESGAVNLMGVPAGDDEGFIYVVSQHFIANAPRHITAVNAQTKAMAWQKPLTLPAHPFDGNEFNLWWDVVIGTLQVASLVTPTMRVLFVNGANGVVAINPADGSQLHSYTLPQVGSTPPSISSAMVYHADRLYFGDSTGKLYVLNALTLTQIATTLDAPQKTWRGILAAPVLIAGKTADDGVVVAFTRGDNSNNSQARDQFIYLFDPATGILDQVRTDQTIPGTLAYDDAHGVLYAMAWPKEPGSIATPELGQLFAIRPDSYIQDERSFIIESDLMQDYANDGEAVKSDGSLGEGVSRYHTHVTMVDANNAPRANQSVKLWADEDGTQVLIDGTAYTIGLNTPAYFTTDATGSFTLVSDAADLATTTLRVWSPFMDEHERIAIVPDAEFHNRLSTTTATGSTDPQQIDMASATSYDGQPLFTDKTQAQQMATATTQLTGAVGIGGNAAIALQGKKVTAPARTHTLDSRYLTYSFLSSAAYTPVNVALNRDVSAQVPLGLHISDQGHTPLTSAQAADLIDQLTGAPPALLGGVLSDLKHAWQEIKQTAAKVTQVVVSVAKDVVAGIQYIVDGVTKVVKAVVKDIKEAVAAIGSFFVQLGKDLLKVLQALSKLLKLGQVFATAKIIRDQVSSTLDGLEDTLNAGKTALSNWIEGGEAAINNEFCNLYTHMGLPGCGKPDPNPISGVDSMGATPTTIYSQATGGGSSQAVQGGWSTHVLRNNMKQASAPTNARLGIAAASADPLEDLVGNFLGTLKTDPALKAAYASMGQSFRATFKASSPEELLKMGLQDLLEVIRVVAVTGLAIGRALLNTLLGAIETLVQGLKNLGTVKIPVLSALWRALTGSELTFLDLVSFVLAFPATFLYRVFKGSYPGDAMQLAAEQSPNAITDVTAPADVAAANSVVSIVMGVVGSISMLLAGMVTAVLDVAASLEIGAWIKPMWKIAGGLLLLANIGMGIYSAVKVAEPNNATIMLATTSTLGLILAIAGRSDPEGTAMANMVMGLFNLVFFSLKFADLGEPVLTLAREILSTVPTLVNLTKFTVFPVFLIAPAADLTFRWAAAGIQLAQVLGAKASERPYDYFLPWVANMR